MKFDKIQGVDRPRDLGDVSGLAASIGAIGLLHPIVVNEDMVLVGGWRRLEAMRSLGWTEGPVRIVDNLTDAARLLIAERDENICRKDMTMSELVSLGERIEELEKPKAAARQVEGGRLGAENRWDGLGSREPKPSEEPYRRTADVVGEALGISRSTYDRAKSVIQATHDEDPEVRAIATEAVKEMDRTNSVRPAARKVRAARKPSPQPKAPTKNNGNRRKHLQVLEALAASLSGLAITANEITGWPASRKELDSSVTNEEATRLTGDLSTSIKALSRINNLLKERTK